MNRSVLKCVATVVVAWWIICGSLCAYGIGPGALGGDRYRVVISSDIGGSDEDDIQSMIHYLVYSDLFDTEGIVSSPPNAGRKGDILKVIDVYEKDYANLKSWSRGYPDPDLLRSVAKQGAVNAAPAKGYSEPTEGSRWIVRCAKKADERPLYVLVWGSITDVAQALHDEPEIKGKIRVHFIASWNQRHDENAFAYIDKHHPDTWMIHNDTTFRGWYMGGEQGGDLGNRSFVERHIKPYGALGAYFATLKGGSIKMGDTPTVSFLLKGTPDDPTKASWGGQYVKKEGRPRWWVDNPDPALVESGKAGARTINRWRVDYLRDWQQRMKRCAGRKAP